MNTEISTKFAALAVALTINGLMLGSVAFVFGGQSHAMPIASVVGVAVSEPGQDKA